MTDTGIFYFPGATILNFGQKVRISVPLGPRRSRPGWAIILDSLALTQFLPMSPLGAACPRASPTKVF